MVRGGARTTARMRAISAVVQIFFAAVLTVVLQRFSEDTVILAELVHLKERPTAMGRKQAMDYVRRTVRGMMYADDT